MPQKNPRGIVSTNHPDNERLNIPPAGLPPADPNPDTLTTYHIDPHDSPSLMWAGKPESQSFTVPATSIHTHEKIYPHRLISPALVDSRQMYLFHDASPEEIITAQARAIDSYNHKDSWTNRMIAGDSLVIMNSLLRKESMSGQVQMIYIDPPYGIKYGSNFQPFVGKRDVKDRGDDDLTAEPEMIRAFRDTWELGIHSYLTYLRSRLYLARELLSDSGSVFVQISDENVHHVREICDEIFGPENFVSMIAFRTAMTKPTKGINNVFDYLVWYAKDKAQYKYRPLYTPKKNPEQENPTYTQLQASTPQTKYKFTYNGVTYNPRNGWRVTEASLTKLAEAGRLYQAGLEAIQTFAEKVVIPTMEAVQTFGEKLAQQIGTLKYIRYPSDFPYDQIDNLWNQQSSEQNKIYAVQTSEKVISRCILMTTDPGDLVLDITCGSGTTAYSAEKWGRRWITCDTSRVAIAIARQRLMTATFDSYRLKSPGNISSGFIYKTVPHVTLKSIANNEPPDTETLYDQPEIDTGKIRVSGPFTVESLPAPSVISLEEAASLDPNEQAKKDGFMSQLMATGIRAKNGERIRFSRHNKLAGVRWIHSEAWTDEDNPKRVLVCFADSNTLMDSKRVSLAIKEAAKQIPYPAMMIFCAFQFSPEAQNEINTLNWQGVRLMQVDMNDDLMTEDLRRKINTDESFWLVGQPDVELLRVDGGKYIVRVLGYDYFSVSKDELISGDADKIAMWGIDPNYDGMMFTPSQIFFPIEGKNGGWSRLEKTLKAEIDSSVMEKFTGIESLPFEAEEGKQIAVKIIDDRGIESMRLLTVEAAQ